MTYVKLSLMMFLQYAIWGAWLPILFPYLKDHRGFSNAEIGTMFAVGAIGAIVAPFVAGQIADRYFNTERYLAFSHLVGGVLVWQLSWLEGFWPFLCFSLIYSLVYAPTMPLTNSLAFHHLKEGGRNLFGFIRLFGTIGWIVVGILVGHWLLRNWTPDAEEPARGVTVGALLDAPSEGVRRALGSDGALLAGVLDEALVEDAREGPVRERLEKAGRAVPLAMPAAGGSSLEPRMDYEAAVALLGADSAGLREAQEKRLGEVIVGLTQAKGMRDAFKISALLGVLMGLFCFLLPKTPPSPGREKNAVLEALGEILRNRRLLHLFIVSVPVACIHQYYFVHTAGFLGAYQVSGAAEGLTRVFSGLFGVGGGGLMTIGQMTEIGVLFLIPFVAKRVSRKPVLLVGLVAYALRMALFVWAPEFGSPMAAMLAGVALHGVCFGCVIFLAFMIVDEETTADVRASAQSLYNLVIVGIGIIVGSLVAGWWANHSQGDAARLDYGVPEQTATLFALPMWVSLACFVYVALLYPATRSERRPAEVVS